MQHPWFLPAQRWKESSCIICCITAGIRDGEADQAIAGGVNAMLSPMTAIKICRLQVGLMMPKAWHKWCSLSLYAHSDAETAGPVQTSGHACLFHMTGIMSVVHALWKGGCI